MRQKMKDKIVTAVLLCILTAGMLLPSTAFAAGDIDIAKPVSLTISYQDASVPLAGARFAAYQVAAVDRYGELTLTDAFEKYKVDYRLDFDIRGRNDDAWRTLAATLAAYVERDAAAGKIKPASSGRTDANGNLTLRLENAEGKPLQGLYLVLGERHTQGGMYYDAAPFLVLLPSLNRDANTWEYTVKAEPKHTSDGGQSYPQTTSRKVIKVWKDSDAKLQRPQQITVQLLRDGEVYSTAELNAQNNWQYSWDGLEAYRRWTIVETVPKDYTVSVTQEGITFVVTNTYQEEPEDPNDPPSDPNTPKDPKGPDQPTNPDSPDTTKLPQTGQLWWPVPVLTAAGLLLIVIGLLRARGRDNETEE